VETLTVLDHYQKSVKLFNLLFFMVLNIIFWDFNLFLLIKSLYTDLEDLYWCQT